MATPPPLAADALDDWDEEERDDDEWAAIDEIRLVTRQMGPWMVSILFHFGLIVLALFFVYLFIQGNGYDNDPFVPNARLTDNPGGLAMSTDIELQASQQQRVVQATDTATEETIEVLTQNTVSQLARLGVSGSNGGGGGKIAPFGATTGTGRGISAGFFGLGGNAKKIVYLIDASGSMVDTLPFVINELNRSISGLSAKQEFNVIFFINGLAVEVPLPRMGWKTADRIAKQQVADWVDPKAGNLAPRGRTDPAQAAKLAMKYKPELIFLLSDNITGHGRYEINRSELLNFFKEADPSGKVVINTIQFLSRDPVSTMRDIAEQHNGSMKFVSETDLGLGGG